MVGSSWKSSETDSTPFLAQKSNQIPNYLELLYDDSDCPLDNDGYEVPNKPDWNQKNPVLPSTSTRTCEIGVKSELNGGVSSFKNVKLDDLTTVERDSEKTDCEK